ncbi:MAG: class I SAM-dependent methyltransferase [Polaromonas sp.]|nr:class I SAM-dependent methyltransferase [Polaromonas sp.]
MTTTPIPHGDEAASAWLQRWSHLLPVGGRVLDVACGRGRHARYLHQLHQRGLRVVAVDRSAEAIAAIDLPPERCETCVADIENGPWPFAGRLFDAIVVTNYLWRPLLPTLITSLVPGGVLVYETFAAGNETVGKPSRPDFLFQPGELLQVCQALRIVAFEDGFEDRPSQRFVQRIVAVRALTMASPPARYPLC